MVRPRSSGRGVRVRKARARKGLPDVGAGAGGRASLLLAVLPASSRTTGSFA